LDVCIKNLTVGQPIRNAYIAARDFIKEKDSHLGSKLHSNFGFGVSILNLNHKCRLVATLKRTH
jgi:hypothetical protein